MNEPVARPCFVAVANGDGLNFTVGQHLFECLLEIWVTVTGEVFIDLAGGGDAEGA